MKKIYINTCKQCGKEFPSTNLDVKTCSTKCGYLYRSKQQLENTKVLYCIICNSSFNNRDKGYSNSKTCGKIECIKEARKRTMLEKYGVENSMQKEEIKQQFKNPRSEEIIQKMKKKWRGKTEKEIKDIVEKRKSTSVVNYGVDNPFKSETIKSKIKRTKIERYGKYYLPLQRAIPLATLEFLDKKENLEELYSNQKLSTPQIADMWNVSGAFIITKLNQHGIKIRKNSTSFAEVQIKNFIEELGFKVQRNSRELLPSGQEIDIFIPSKKIGIEFNGLYWHSEQVLNNQGRDGKRYHLNKTKECESAGIKLIHIYEDDWEVSRNITKRRIRAVLGKEEERYLGRKCEVRKISFTESSSFLNLYHLQGSSFSSIRLGLFYNNNIVACMTFSSFNRGKKESGIFELTRYCSKGRVLGGASKLFSYFLRNYNPVKVISYADRNWSSPIFPNLYIKLGFNQVGEGSLNYWYFLKGYKEHRFNYRKSELSKKLKVYDPLLTEYQNMVINNYDRIWGCGTLRYEYIV